MSLSFDFLYVCFGIWCLRSGLCAKSLWLCLSSVRSTIPRDNMLYVLLALKFFAEDLVHSLCFHSVDFALSAY